MKTSTLFRSFIFPAAITAVVMLSAYGCSDNDSSPTNSPPPANNPPPRAKFTGAVYTMSNAAQENQVVVFSQAPDGSLEQVQKIGAGAAGPGKSPTSDVAPIDTENEMVLSPDHKFLFVVDAGADKISAFEVHNPEQVNRKGQTFSGSLQLVDTVDSGGAFPASLAVNGNTLYVVNARADAGKADMGGDITGFTFDDQGQLSPIPNSTQPLSGKQTPLPGHQVQPGGIVFSPDGNYLVVTEKATNLIDVYPVSNGVAGPPVVSPSAGTTPFGAVFDSSGHLIVSNANVSKASGKPKKNASSVSSYDIGSDASLNVVSAQVKTFSPRPAGFA